ncbi:MAG TPA: hypothetical protein VG694_02245 [Candidatus Paceibacterota bacterium]|jgi:hypothetical protein|nr:hypothetical protein [Candidatus Paceibacterota bacterium]
MKKYVRSPSLWEFFVIAVVPPLLLAVHLLPSKIHPYVLILVVAVVILIARLRNYTLESLSISIPRLDFVSVAVFLSVISLFGIWFIFLRETYANNEANTLGLYTLARSMLYSFLQVFLYQSYLMKIGEKIFRNDFANIGINATSFACMHIFYRLALGDYLLIGVAGLGFNLYYRYVKRNFWILGLFHFSTNMMAIHLGMFHPG